MVLQILIAQKEKEKPELEKGAIKAVQDLYDVVRHDVLSINMRYVSLATCWFCGCMLYLFFSPKKLEKCSRENYETWNLLSKARTEGRLFAKLKWPKDRELVLRPIFFLLCSFPLFFFST